jgi:flagellar biosynthesis protein FlhF
MSSPTPTAAKPGATYKFIVRTAEEAVQTIRDRLGPNAKVLSVRQVAGQGLGSLFAKPKLEVIAQMEETPSAAGASDSASAASLSSLSGLRVSAEPALPANFAEVNPSAANGIDPPPSEQVFSRSDLTGLPAGTAPGGGAAPHSRRDVSPRLPELLRKSGFSELMLSRLQGTPAFSSASDLPLHRGLVEVGQELRRQLGTRRPRPLPARSAFLGTPGVGRTTALCKWLAKEVFANQRVGRVIKAEFDRPNPAEGLAVFCEALGLGLEYYSPESGDAPSTLGGPGSEFLYADLPGLSLRSLEENADIARFLDREKFAGRVLVLNAAYDAPMLRRGYAAGVELGSTHVVFTHLDEVDHWGKLWDFLLEGALTPLFLATGPSLTGDCEENPGAAVLRKTLPGA